MPQVKTKIRSNGKSTRNHVIVVEKALRRAIQRSEMVHHIDGNQANDKPGNLILCPDMAYHSLLHMRQEALDTCGNADYKRCCICKIYTDPVDMQEVLKPGTHVYKHFTCKFPSRAERFINKVRRIKETSKVKT